LKDEKSEVRVAICINDGGYIDDLKVMTVYQVLPDESAARSNYVRVIDETGEDYLYSANLFVPIEVPREVEDVFKFPRIEHFRYPVDWL
jgi:hypothetical protein